jgi:phage N-6-adenine-methyltransferase
MAQSKVNPSLFSSDSSEWETPQSLFDLLDDEFGFTVDVCASESNRKVQAFYSKADDALSLRWPGVAWMNPPYGSKIDQWVEKASRESELGSVVVCLVPVRSDTRWWHRWVMRSSEIRFLTRRLSFVGSSNKAPFPAAIVVFRPYLTVPVVRSLPI